MRLLDLHVRLGESAFGYALDIPTLTSRMDELDIAHAVLCPVRPREGHLASANEAVAAAVQAEPRRFSGFARVDPWLRDAALAELERAVDQLRLSGLLLDPWEDRFVISDTLVDPIVEHATRRGLPILIAGGYANTSHPTQIGALAKRHPEARLIATHGGQLNISGLLLGDARTLLQNCANVSIETSGVYREDFIEDTVAEFGAHRVFFGSSAPVFDQRLEVLRIRLAHLPDEAKAAVGYRNAAQLLGQA